MTSETDEQFVERIESRWMIAAPEADINRLFALARRGASPAGWEWMREQAAKCVEDNAAVLDHPSVYMGGPSRVAKMKAGFFAEAIRALPPPPAGEPRDE